jgi:crotonobetainyl-CoA:carnitine CoA-transferase CaiB-like acyl-CoA transferase
MSKGPLDGIRVVDVSAAVAGPWASTQLADNGAEVILVERVGQPDVMRLTGAVAGDQSGSWVAMHRNKRAITLDLSDERGRDILKRLATEADVFIQNFRPGVAQRLGIAYEELSVVNPDLVYCSVSGFGPDGPYADQPVYDPIVQALSGMTEAQNGDFVKAVVVDKTTALTAANSILAALVARANGAGGQHVEVNLLDSMLAWLWLDVYWNDALPDAEPVPTYSEWYSPYDTLDGQVATVWTSFKQFAAAATALGRPDLADDQRFATRDSRLRHSHEMRAEFADALAQLTTAAAVAALRGADVPCAPVLDRHEVASDPQVVHNGSIVEAEHPTAGRMRTVRPVAHYSETPTTIHRPAPGLGEHNHEVLTELGFTGTEIAQLEADGVTG